MNSKLLEFIMDNSIEIHECEGTVWICVPYYLLEKFVSSCQNDKCKFDFENDGVFENAGIAMGNKYLSVDINTIVEALEENINDYIALCC